MTELLTNLYSQFVPVPADGFYYTLFIILAGALIWIIKVYISRTEATLKQVAQSVSNMDKILAIHEHRHERHEKEIEELKSAIKKG